MLKVYFLRDTLQCTEQMVIKFKHDLKSGIRQK
jgi:hypothetical protein